MKGYRAKIKAFLPEMNEKEVVVRSVEELMAMLGFAVTVDIQLNRGSDVVLTLFTATLDTKTVHVEYTRRDGTEKGTPFILVDAEQFEIEEIDAAAAPASHARTPGEADILPSDVPEDVQTMYSDLLSRMGTPKDPKQIN